MKSEVASFLFKIKYRNKCKFGKKVFINKFSHFEGGNTIKNNSQFINSYIGMRSYIGQDCRFNDTYIGRYTSIASNVISLIGTHPIEKFVSTHPYFYSPSPDDCNYFNEFSKAKNSNYSIVIGNDVWICENVMLMQGITIGDGAIVAAGAIVTKDVPPFAVVGGVPAKFLRYRFSQEEIKYLLEIKWWNKGQQWIDSNYTVFRNINLFMNRGK